MVGASKSLLPEPCTGDFSEPLLPASCSQYSPDLNLDGANLEQELGPGLFPASGSGIPRVPSKRQRLIWLVCVVQGKMESGTTMPPTGSEPRALGTLGEGHLHIGVGPSEASWAVRLQGASILPTTSSEPQTLELSHC